MSEVYHIYLGYYTDPITSVYFAEHYSLGSQPCHYPLIHLNYLVAAAVEDKIVHQSELL